MHDGDAAALLDRDHADRPVVERARQNDADHARPVCDRGRAEQRVNRGAAAVLTGPVYDADALALDEKVVVGRRDVDAPVSYRLAVNGVRGAERPLAVEDLRQYARRVRRDVQDGEDGCLKVFGQLARDLSQSLDPSG